MNKNGFEFKPRCDGRIIQKQWLSEYKRSDEICKTTDIAEVISAQKHSKSVFDTLPVPALHIYAVSINWNQQQVFKSKFGKWKYRGLPSKTFATGESI